MSLLPALSAVHNACHVLDCMTENLFLHDPKSTVHHFSVGQQTDDLLSTFLQNNRHKSDVWNCTIFKEFLYVKADLQFISPSPKQSEPVLGPDSGIQTGCEHA